MALGGNPIFNGKNFRGATQAPPVPQAQYGQNPYGQAPYGQNPYGQLRDAPPARSWMRRAAGWPSSRT